MDGGIGVVIFIFPAPGVPVVVTDEGAGLSLQPVAAMRAKAVMQASERCPSRIPCIDFEPSSESLPMYVSIMFWKDPIQAGSIQMGGYAHCGGLNRLGRPVIR
jgi:hypothetical protein